MLKPPHRPPSLLIAMVFLKQADDFGNGRVNCCSALANPAHNPGTTTMTFHISIATASSELSDTPINLAITKMAAAALNVRRTHPLPQGPTLDINFMLPGKLDKPDFSGMRMGGYTPEQNTLYFEKAVPEQMIYSQCADEFVSLVLQDVVANAHAFFSSSQQQFNLLDWELLVQHITGSAPPVITV